MAKRFQRIAPSLAGVDASGVEAFINRVDAEVGGLHSVMMLRDGNVFAECWWNPYKPDYQHTMYSLSKSFTSTAAGFAMLEGKLRPTDPVIKFFPDKLPAKVSANLGAMQVQHLLMMGTGHATEPNALLQSDPNADWVKVFLNHPVEFAPGSHFVYNSAATFMVSAIVQQVTGQTVLDYLGPRLFRPLGIENPVWETNPAGITAGGWGLHIRTEDIAALGELYRNKGVWKGRRILPRSFVDAATQKQISNGNDPNSDWAQGYGYQFWRCKNNGFRGDGAFGQYCLVFPDKQLTVAITSGVADMQRVLDILYATVLPAVGASTNAPADKRLAERTRKAEVPVPKAVTSRVRLPIGKTYTFDANAYGMESIRFAASGGGVEVTVNRNSNEQTLLVMDKGWKVTDTTWEVGLNRLQTEGHTYRNAARGAWTSASVYSIKNYYVEEPYIQSIDLSFGPGTLIWTSSFIAMFGGDGRITASAREVKS